MTAELLERVAVAGATLVDVMTMFGFTVNISKGKTEAIVAFNGPGSAAARTERRQMLCGREF